MADWHWAWRKEADFDRSRRELRHALPVEAADGEELAMTDSLLFGVIPARFEWEIQPDAGTYRLVERAFVSKDWTLLFSIALLGLSAGLAGIDELQGTADGISFAIICVGLLLLLVVFGSYMRFESPVKDVFQRSGRHIEYIPLASLLVVVFILFLAVMVLDGIGRLVVLEGMFLYVGWYYRYQSVAAEFSFRWQSWFVARMRQFPLIASNYIASILLSTVILALFLVPHKEPLFLTLTAAYPVAFPGILSLITLYLLIALTNVFPETWQYETNRFRRHGRNIKQPTTIVLTGIIVVAFSTGFGLLSYHFLVRTVWFLTHFGTIGISVFILVAALPIGFFGLGLCYQGFTVIRSLFIIFQNIEQRDMSHILDVETETYVLDYSGVFAGALSVFDDYIIVSQGILDGLEEGELAVVLAHEEAHLKHDEARMSLLIAVLSPLLLTGKNVFYGITDFRAREYRADREAASRLDDKQQVIEALDALQTLEAETSAKQISTITPTLVALDSEENTPSLLDRAFGFFFGDFAFTKAHPTIEERKTELR